MKLIEQHECGVYVLEPNVFGDHRGFFLESYHRGKFAELGITDEFVQDNHSSSIRGTLRGLHYQINHPQAKLCRVTKGAVLDVALDVRRGSPHFGQWVGVLLTEENKRLVYVPAGFAHGFLVVSETAEFLYKCSDFYDAADEGGVAWNDPQLSIDWQLDKWGIAQPILSDKDRRSPSLADITPDRLPLYRSKG